MYRQSPAPSRPQPKRGECKGWTKRASRSNTDFLLSVIPDRLTGYGYALSLTLKDCPPTPADWQKLQRRFLDRLVRRGLIRNHKLTEWQRRQVPHLHGAVWFPEPVDPSTIIFHWIQVAKQYGARIPAQNVRRIDGPAGWFEYLGKHAARGVAHYQRSPDLIPPGWQGNTGRMWSAGGDWPRAESKLVDYLPEPVEHQYRRLMIRYQIGKARRQRDRGRERYMRSYLSHAPRETSAAAALPRLWIPEEDQWSLLAAAMASHTPKEA